MKTIHADQSCGIVGPSPLLLCFSHLRWDFVFQRPQHLLSRAALDYRVIFWEEPAGAAEQKPGIVPRLETRITAQGVMVATPVLPPGLDIEATNRVLIGLLDGLLAERGVRPSVVWYYSPMFLPIAAHVSAQVTVYDCMDELSLFEGASPQLRLLERRLLKSADLVFAGGRSLFQSKRALHGHVHCFPSSVDVGHFRIARLQGGLADPSDQARLARPRLGYFGVIDERMDLALVAGIADRRPDWQIMMLGPVAKIDPASLPQRDNVHWLGGKPYAALPAYLAHWDVGLMPFALNASTRFISPTKTPEYLAAGVPVISTPIADVVSDWGEGGFVEIASTAEQAVAAAERVMARGLSEWQTRVDMRLAHMSWDRTWAAMRDQIDQFFSAPAPMQGRMATLGQGVWRTERSETAALSRVGD